MADDSFRGGANSTAQDAPGICYCALCPNKPSFVSMEAYFAHHRLAHGGKKTNNGGSDRGSGDGDSSFLCPFCPFDMFFATQQELSIHLKRAHSNEMDSLEAGPSTSDTVSSKRKKAKELPSSLVRKKSNTSGNTAVTNLLGRLEQVKNEHQRIAHDTNSLKGSLNGLSDVPNPVCMCSICPEHPTFLNEEDYFVHYKLFHEEPDRLPNVPYIVWVDVGDGFFTY
ncbi:uncharacterized protein [Clytia hemisphaerica]|uniref:uncharacterized protein n=1 Tax=Clytia hemisphaerica TaxID=252671 RepID=UPI0034D44FF3